MIDDDFDDLTLADTDPTAQALELTDSLDLSRLNCPDYHRTILADILSALQFAHKIPCAHVVIYSSENNCALLSWRYEITDAVVIAALLTVDLNNRDQIYGFKTSAGTSRTVNYESFWRTLQPLANKHDKRTKESQPLYAIN